MDSLSLVNFNAYSVADLLLLVYLFNAGNGFSFDSLKDFPYLILVELYLFLGPAVSQILGTAIFDALILLRDQMDQSALEGIEIAGLASLLLGNLHTVIFAVVDVAVLALDALVTVETLIFPAGVVLVLFSFFFIVAPIGLQILGIAILAVFVAVFLGLGMDALYLLATGAQMEDAFFYSLIQLQEQTVEQTFGLDFSASFSASIFDSLIEDIWLHVALQALVVVPIVLLLTGVEMSGFFIGTLMLAASAIQYSSDIPGWIFTFFQFTGIMIMALYVSVGGLWEAILRGNLEKVFTALNITVNTDIYAYLLGADFGFSFFFENLGLVEGIYWATYFGLKSYNKAGELTQQGRASAEPSSRPPEVGRTILDDIIPTLAGLNELFFGDIMTELRNWIVKPLIIVVAIPLLQAVIWGLQAVQIRNLI